VRVVVLTAPVSALLRRADMKNRRRAGRILGPARPGGFGGIALRDTLNLPVIARVNGFALGGGFEMVLGCDIVVAARRRARPARAAVGGCRSMAA